MSNPTDRVTVSPVQAQQIFDYVEEKTCFRADPTVHEYGGEGYADGVHRADCRWCAFKEVLARGDAERAPAPVSRELVPVQYLAGLMEGAIWAERPDEVSYCPRPELVEQWAAEIAPHIESYVRTALAGASARAALPSEPEAWPSDDVAPTGEGAK